MNNIGCNKKSHKRCRLQQAQKLFEETHRGSPYCWIGTG